MRFAGNLLCNQAANLQLIPVDHRQDSPGINHLCNHRVVLLVSPAASLRGNPYWSQVGSHQDSRAADLYHQNHQLRSHQPRHLIRRPNQQIRHRSLPAHQHPRLRNLAVGLQSKSSYSYCVRNRSVEATFPVKSKREGDSLMKAMGVRSKV